MLIFYRLMISRRFPFKAIRITTIILKVLLFLFQCMVTLILLLLNNVESLIVYVTSVEALFILCSVIGLLWMRYTRPELNRPIKVSLVLPLSFFVISVFLVVLSCITHPLEVGIGIVFIALGVPVYMVFIYWENKPEWFLEACHSFNIACSKMFMSLPEDSKEL